MSVARLAPSTDLSDHRIPNDSPNKHDKTESSDLDGEQDDDEPIAYRSRTSRARYICCAILLSVTIIIVSHDRAITQRVDRVVTMRDGRTSGELVRPRSYRRERLEMQEFTLVDRSGRMQIPREYMERLGIGGRARVELHNDHVEVRPGSPDGPLT